ncbi:MAG: DeoR/GlpR family DNA-binding transcription regulator [Actinomycetota bacterium]|nr:DeoR/GlpR family DNA-binding transcription regulator [Actinomycetota bacterium]
MATERSFTGEVRKELIRDALARDGAVRIAELAARLDVSQMTVRRDLDALAEAGVVHRVRGGAFPVGARPLADRVEREAAAKAAIARKLVDLVPASGAIGLDASSTMQYLATELVGGDAVGGLTVMTNSPETAQVLRDAPVTALLTGGQIDRRTGSLIGPLATRSVGAVLLGRLFLSASGVDPVHGSTEAAFEDAEVKQALAAVASEVIVAVDHTKLGTPGPVRCLGWSDLSLLVTDLDADDERLAPYRDHVEVR